MIDIEKRKKILDWLRARGIKDYKEVIRYINMYYKEPGVLMRMIEEGIVEEKAGEKPLQTMPRHSRWKSILELFGFKFVKEAA